MPTEQRMRLKGIDTLEIWRQKKDSAEYKAGLAAIRFVEKRLKENGNEFMMRTDELPGVYGRYIGRIILDDSEESLNDELLRLRIAKSYEEYSFEAINTFLADLG